MNETESIRLSAKMLREGATLEDLEIILDEVSSLLSDPTTPQRFKDQLIYEVHECLHKIRAFLAQDEKGTTRSL
jgi:hypothetical protein